MREYSVPRPKCQGRRADTGPVPRCSDEPVPAGGEGSQGALLLGTAHGTRTERADGAERVLWRRTVADEVGREDGRGASLAHLAVHGDRAVVRALLVDEGEGVQELLGRRGREI